MMHRDVKPENFLVKDPTANTSGNDTIQETVPWT